MIERRYVFPGVLEMNYQAQRRMGVNIYLVDGGTEFALIDVGFLDELPDVLELIRQMDYQPVRVQDDRRDARRRRSHPGIDACTRRPQVPGGRASQERRGDRGGGRDSDLRADRRPGNSASRCPDARSTWPSTRATMLQIGDKTLEVWSTPGHTAGQLALRMGNLLFSGDNIFRDGSVGVIDAHHGSNLLDFIASLKRILASDVDYLLPSHGPIFRKDDALIRATIARLESYTHMADFGTCAVDWPLMDAVGRRACARRS